MKYLNRRTGVVIDVPCRVEGPDWEEVTEAKKAEKTEKAPEKAELKRKTARKGAEA